jgi:hypothetical protein
MGFWSSLFGRSRAADEPPAPIEITSSLEDDGFVDLTFALERRSAREFVAHGTHRGTAVAFSVELGRAWDSSDAGGITLMRGRAVLRSVGARSDAFVRALAGLYGIDEPGASMLAAVEVEAVALGGDPQRLDEGSVRLKLFFNSDGDASEALYAEAYLNLDLAAGRLDFNEKDHDYRRPLLGALTKAP